MPSQCSMANTVVAFRVAPLSPCSTGRAGLACTPSASAVRLARGATPLFARHERRRLLILLLPGALEMLLHGGAQFLELILRVHQVHARAGDRDAQIGQR